MTSTAGARGAPDASAAAPGGTRFSAASLESLRADMSAFAGEREWDGFHTPRNLLLALTGEVGELAELFQWRGDAGAAPGLPGWNARDAEHLGEELSDVLLYLVRLADRCGVDLAAAAARKMALNRIKYPADRARGSSQKYTAYAAPAGAADGSAGSAADTAPARAAAAAAADPARAAAATPAPAPPPAPPAERASPTDPTRRALTFVAAGGGSGGASGGGGGGAHFSGAAAAALCAALGAAAGAALGVALALRRAR